MRAWRTGVCGAAWLLLAMWAGQANSAELKVLLPLARTAYQTNEQIDVSVVRTDGAPLKAGDLTLSLAGRDGSQLAFTFPVAGGSSPKTEHLRVNGHLLRPGGYELTAACDGAQAKAQLDVYSHIRKTSYRIINWGRATGAQQLVEGEDSLGYNLFYGHYGDDKDSNFIRAGLDYVQNCTMSGGHQMDLRSECDWSDPYVTRGGTRRVVRQALKDRTKGNVLGVHFYDEPGLTWTKNPVTGEFGPHFVPSQVRSFEAAFGRKPLLSHEVDAKNPSHRDQWRQWATWKLGFMDAAWKESQFGVSYVRPNFLSLTQSQYGFSAYTDGYYFNVTRSLPIASGHGGYDDYGPGYFNPSYTLEMSRARDLSRDCWYLPTWYGNTPADRYRLEQYVSFITGIEGMMSPPDIDPYEPNSKPAAEGVVETNKLMARLGTVFTTMPVTRPPVAMLYSLSQCISVQTGDMQANYMHSHRHGLQMPFTYLAGKVLQHQFLPIVEEDIADGTLAAEHKALVITAVDFLPAKVIASLEAYIKEGGLVLLTGDCAVKINGAVNLGVIGQFPDQKQVDQFMAEKKYQDAAPFMTVGKFLQGVEPLAKAIGARLTAAGIAPPITSDNPGITAARQADGDIEYIFAVNTSYDPQVGGLNAIQSAVATLGLPDDGRPVYDAVIGGPAAGLAKAGGKLSGSFRFGPGQLRAFARTARPIGKVSATQPLVRRDHTQPANPLSLELGAVLLDNAGRVLTGSAPLEIRVSDPAGYVRYHLYRATDDGSLKVSVPLAANDPAGTWKVTVRELLSNTEDAVGFNYKPLSSLNAVAGAAPRAVSFGDDANNAFRFFRVHHDVTIVVGTAPYYAAAAERLKKDLSPWGVRCKIVPAAEVNKARSITEEEAKTWVGLDFAGSNQIKPGAGNGPGQVGFALDGPAVLIGTPADNPLVEFLHKQKFLPYEPTAEFPGPGRGYFAWQRDGLGAGQDSITLIATDEAGLAEAVGTLYEAVAGLEGLTPLQQASSSSITPAKGSSLPELPLVWSTALPDRAVGFKVQGADLHIATLDGSLVKLDAQGKILSSTPVKWSELNQTAAGLKTQIDGAVMSLALKAAPKDRIVKYASTSGGKLAIAYWGGTLQTVDPSGSLKTTQQLPVDVTGVAWLEGSLVVGLSDGRVLAFKP